MMNKVIPVFAVAVLFLTGCACGGDGTAAVFPAKDQYKVTVLGDIHFDGEEYHITSPTSPTGIYERKRNLAQWKGKSQQVLAAAAKQCDKESAFIIQLGDITQGDCDNAELQGAAFKDVFATLKKYFPNKRILSLTGNHDIRGKEDAPKAVDKVFVPLLQKELGGNVRMDGTNYAVRYGKDLYIFYDYSKKSSGDFVKKALEKNTGVRHVFFLTHLPIFPCSAGNPGWLVPDFKELIPLLVKHKAVVLCAHTHFWSEIIYQNQHGILPQFVITSMGSEWFPGKKFTKRYNSYIEWKNNIKPHYLNRPEYSESLKNLEFFKPENFRKYQAYRSIPSGFVNLEVTDEKVVIHVFTDNSGKPVKSVIIKSGI